MVRVGVLGANGYGGAGLIPRLLSHSGVELTALGSRSQAGRTLGEVWPQLDGLTDLSFVAPDAVLERCEVVFCATPHGATAPWVRRARDAGLRVVDLSADSRLPPETYALWYREHPHPELWQESRYGLVEWHRDELPGAELVAAPGCNATAVSLALAPLAARGVLGEDAVCTVIAAASGAGRAPAPALHYAELNESARPYKVAGMHRHAAEIELTAGRAATSGRRLHTHGDARPLRVSFTPHLVPMTRGILATCTLRPSEELSGDALLSLLEDTYRNDPMVHVQEALPDTKAVAGSDRALLSARVDERTGLASLFCVIDNLGKGAGGQALQAFNVAFGFPETEGLRQEGTWP